MTLLRALLINGRKSTQILLPSQAYHEKKWCYHTAEVLWQAESANVVRGGWVGGDAWFGSIESCIELKKHLGLHSTFIIKQNVQYFPKKILHFMLVARHGSHTAGH